MCAKYPPERTNAQDLTELRMVNLTPNCNNFAFLLTFITNKQVMFGYTTECLNPIGLIKISGFKNDSIYIDYKVQKDSKTTISKKFIGIRK